jgi:hypothetical protein
MKVLGYQRQPKGMVPNPMRMIMMVDDAGLLWTVPDDPANRHRQDIADWEAEGNTIPEEAPPA